MNTVLITGANGFLGDCLVNKMISLGNYQLFTLSRNKERLKEKYREAQLTHFDLEDFYQNRICFDKIDVVIHCAFARAHKGGNEIAKSLLFTQKLFFELSNNNVSSVINISTQEVYGKISTPWKEDQEVIPNTIYGTAKYYTELLADNFSEKDNSYVTNIRLAGLLGVGTDSRMVNKFIDRAINDEPLQIAGGKLTFSQLDVKDAASGIIALISIPSEKWKSKYNLGFTKSYSIQEIASIVQTVGKEFNIEVVINIEKSDLIIQAELDSTTLYHDTNWKPECDMEAIVREIFDYKLNQ